MYALSSIKNDNFLAIIERESQYLPKPEAALLQYYPRFMLDRLGEQHLLTNLRARTKAGKLAVSHLIFHFHGQGACAFKSCQ